jgi:hypothetical protein
VRLLRNKTDGFCALPARKRGTLKAMPDAAKIFRVHLSISDVMPIIQQKGAEQGVNVSGPLSHYAHDQAHLMLAAEDLYAVLSRVVKEAKRLKANHPLGSHISDELLTQATEVLNRVLLQS